MESLHRVGQNPHLMGLSFDEFDLIIAFTVDGFVTTFSWWHVTFTALTGDLFPPHCCSLPRVACLREARVLHPSQSGCKKQGQLHSGGCTAVLCLTLVQGAASVVAEQESAPAPACAKPSVPACPKSCPKSCPLSCLQGICRVFSGSEQSLCASEKESPKLTELPLNSKVASHILLFHVVQSIKILRSTTSGQQ